MKIDYLGHRYTARIHSKEQKNNYANSSIISIRMRMCFC